MFLLLLLLFSLPIFLFFSGFLSGVLQVEQPFLCLQQTSVLSKEPLLFWTVMLHMTPESISGSCLSVCVLTYLYCIVTLLLSACLLSNSIEYIYSSSIAASSGIAVACRSSRPAEAASPCARAPSLLARRGQVTLGITPAP